MKLRQKLFLAGLLMVIFTLSIVVLVKGDPVGGTILTNTTSTRGSTPDNRSDDGGTITTITVDATQQNYAWKAYVGNISGTLVLDDSSGRSIYGWSLATLTGEIFATRSSSPSWSALSCASNAVIASEQTVLTMSTSDIDSINHTFNETTHQTFTIAGNTLSQSTCRVAYPYVNDTFQTPSTTNYFQEILINDTNQNLIYASELEADKPGYIIGSSMDFQMIVPDNDEAGNQTTYFFYVELGG
ncbi:hypothetical protein ACFLTH_13100 [Bacteroidota bacterium]